MEAVSKTLPPPGEWDESVKHSLAYPSHILGPYEDEDGQMHMECMGDGDPYGPSNCDFVSVQECGRCGSIMHRRCYPAPVEYS